MDGLWLCTETNCGRVATSVGANGAKKLTCCKSHMSSSLHKGYIFVGIEGCGFIACEEDIPLYQARKKMKDKGIQNLTSLNNDFETEFNAAFKELYSQKKKVIAAVDARFAEMRAALKSSRTAVENQLRELKVNLEQFTDSKDNRLSHTAELLCAEVAKSPEFLRFRIADASENISKALSECWAIGTGDVHSTLRCLDNSAISAAIEDALEEAADFAGKGIPEALRYVDSLTEGGALRGEGTVKVLEVLVEKEKRKVEETIKWLQRCLDLRQRLRLIDQDTAKMGQRLGVLYCQCRRFPEAESVLQDCYYTVSYLRPPSEGSISLLNELCGVHFASGNYPQAEALSLRVMEILGTSNLSAEKYWTVLFYLTHSMQLQQKSVAAHAALEDWRGRSFSEETPLAEMLRLLTCGCDAYYTRSMLEAREVLEKSTRIGRHHFPTSLFTALSTSCFAVVSADNTRITHSNEHEITALSTLFVTPDISV